MKKVFLSLILLALVGCQRTETLPPSVVVMPSPSASVASAPKFADLAGWTYLVSDFNDDSVIATTLREHSAVALRKPEVGRVPDIQVRESPYTFRPPNHMNDGGFDIRISWNGQHRYVNSGDPNFRDEADRLVAEMAKNKRVLTRLDEKLAATVRDHETRAMVGLLKVFEAKAQAAMAIPAGNHDQNPAKDRAIFAHFFANRYCVSQWVRLTQAERREVGRQIRGTSGDPARVLANPDGIESQVKLKGFPENYVAWLEERLHGEFLDIDWMSALSLKEKEEKQIQAALAKELKAKGLL